MSAMYCTLDERGLVRFDGPEAQSFLHGQLTCDVNALAAPRATYGAYCTPKGRALATFLLWSSPEGYTMQLPRALCEPIRKRLSMYILRAKVRATDVSAELEQYGVAGDGAAALAEAAAGVLAPAPGCVAQGPHATLVGLSERRFLVVVPRPVAAAARDALDRGDKRHEEWWNALDIEAGIPTVLPATQELFVPQMLNLDAIGGVSFAKGCYPGQEIVARMHYLGRLKERMFRARVESREPPEPGSRIFGADFGAQAAGTVVAASPAGESASELLAVVQTSSVAAGALRLGSPEGPTLTLEPLPYELPAK